MKRALVTGSGRGIGYQIGLDLLKAGYFVYFQDKDNIPPKLENSAFIQADLSYIEELDKIVKQIPVLDALILNAGITDRTPFGKIALENWNKVFNVNLTNQFFLIQDLKDKINPNSKIVFISSITGIVPDAVSISYGVSKAAINMLVPYLAKEFVHKKITVNAIAPGYIMTDWHKGKDKAQIKRIAKKCLANRLGTPEEVSKIVLNIINNDFINGQIIRIDGGFGL